MASMLLHTDTLLTADLSSEEARNSLAHLHEQCRWLERLSQKLLKLFARKEDIRVQPENIRELLDDVKGSMAETLRERKTPLFVECDTETMDVDYDLMKSLLVNLVDNASKASAPGQEIRLCAHEGFIEVSDSGSGISPEDMARVTDAFYMADRSRSRKDGGSGLGLALAKGIADAHGAELVLESGPTAGTTARVVFAIGNQ
jgi:signal transduction histidine kinase